MRTVTNPQTDFNIWWYNIGSGIIPIPGDDMEEHTKRVANCAWLNATDKAKAQEGRPPCEITKFTAQ